VNLKLLLLLSGSLLTISNSFAANGGTGAPTPLLPPSLMPANGAQLAPSANTPPAADVDLPTALGIFLRSPGYLMIKQPGVAAINMALIHSVYDLRGDAPIFVGVDGINSLGQALREVFNQTPAHGLNTEDYLYDEILARWDSKDAVHLAELDMMLVQAYVKYASHLSTGRVQPKKVDEDIDFKKRSFSDFQKLSDLIASGPQGLAAGLNSLEPQLAQYQKLSVLLTQLLDLKKNGGWPTLTNKGSLKVGQTAAVVAPLRARLASMGYMPADAASNQSPIYDVDLDTAAKKYQDLNKLRNTSEMIAHLNVPVEARIAQVSATLEKLRWLPIDEQTRQLPTDNKGRYILVNTALQEFRLFNHDVIDLEMRTVNGRVLRPTPSMTTSMYDVTLNPSWNVPVSLAVRDELVSQESDPGFMAHGHFHLIDPNQNGEDVVDVNTNLDKNGNIFDWSKIGVGNMPYLIRQEPGLSNALGLVKFNLSNNRAIYLHDTNQRNYFALITRLKSSGCVRLQKPKDLAVYLLKDLKEPILDKDFDRLTNNWRRACPDLRAKYQPALASDKKAMSTCDDLHIPLEKPLPVYIAHLTASLSDDGLPRFTEDFYGQDHRLLELMRPVK
jgi:murein L,D-transpeptidase YcbB/YkuD